MTNLLAWRFFFLSVGLFFSGLSLGILGSTSSEKSRESAWILLIVGGMSLILGLVLWTLQVQKEKRLLGHQTRIALRPLDLPKVFDSMLHSSTQMMLLKGRNFLSEARIVLHAFEIALPPHKQLIIHHYNGLPVEIRVGEELCVLGTGNLLRLPAQSVERILRVKSLEPSGEEVSLQTRSPQMILHTIEEVHPS